MTDPTRSEPDPFGAGTVVSQAMTPGGPVQTGDRVRLLPQGNADILDIALGGRTATVEAIEQDLENRLYVVVVLDDDPGREFGHMRKPAHCFFFRPDEVQPLNKDERGTS